MPTGSVSGTLVRNTAAGLVVGLVLGVVLAWLLLERRRAAEDDATVESLRDVAAEPDDLTPARPRSRSPRRPSAASR